MPLPAMAAVSVPTIGIGASPACDGQVLVVDDVTGVFDQFMPKFVKRYADVGRDTATAVAAYAADVRARRFPMPEHCFSTDGKGASATQPSPKAVKLRPAAKKTRPT